MALSWLSSRSIVNLVVVFPATRCCFAVINKIVKRTRSELIFGNFCLPKWIAVLRIQSFKSSHHSWSNGKAFLKQICHWITSTITEQKSLLLKSSKFSRQKPGPWEQTLSKFISRWTESWLEKTQGRISHLTAWEDREEWIKNLSRQLPVDLSELNQVHWVCSHVFFSRCQSNGTKSKKSGKLLEIQIFPGIYRIHVQNN